MNVISSRYREVSIFIFPPPFKREISGQILYKEASNVVKVTVNKEFILSFFLLHIVLVNVYVSSIIKFMSLPSNFVSQLLTARIFIWLYWRVAGIGLKNHRMVDKETSVIKLTVNKKHLLSFVLYHITFVNVFIL